MSAVLPFIGYRTASTLKIPEGASKSEDKKSEALIESFVEIVSRPHIKDILLSTRGFLHGTGFESKDWLSEIIVEDNADSRTKLEELIKHQVCSFSIVVPNYDHIREGNLNRANALKLLRNRYVPVIDAQQAINNYGDPKSKMPKMGLEKWIKFIKKEYMDNRAALERSCLARFGANGLD